MEFNINGKVWVRLTPDGVEAYKRYYAGLEMEPPTPELVGFEAWACFQMWELMHIFGPHTYNSGKQMFENNIMRFQPPD